MSGVTFTPRHTAANRRRSSWPDDGDGDRWPPAMTRPVNSVHRAWSHDWHSEAGLRVAQAEGLPRILAGDQARPPLPQTCCPAAGRD